MSLPAVSVSQSYEDKFREYLASRPRPQRFTDQQRAMVDFIFKQHNHFDADQLIDQMKDAKLKVSRATVYRTLSKLVDAGLLREMQIGAKKCYEHDYGYPEHEHMKCSRCQKMIEFESSDLDALLREVCRRHHFNLNGYTLILQGLCETCNRERVNKRRLDLI